jgi:hypothetical protein
MKTLRLSATILKGFDLLLVLARRPNADDALTQAGAMKTSAS